MEDGMNRLRSLVVSGSIIIHQFLESSDDSSSEEEDVIAQVALKKYKVEKRLSFNYIDIIDQFSEEAFRKNFRLKKDTFYLILDLIKKKLTNKRKCGRKQTSPKIQLLLTLWFFANPDSYRELCSRFPVGMATAVRSVRRVVEAIYTKRSLFICWPDNPMENVENFQTRWGFSGTIAAVDGTHINIPLYANGQGYINRKNQSSIQLQVVADHSMKFIHCYTGEVGSVHDQRVFRLSGLQAICNSNHNFPNDTYLIGDAAYTLQEHVLVPFKNNGHLTAAQINYNTRLSKARLVVERAIGLFKGRWRRLLRKLPMIRIDLILQFIISVCVLHNICIFQNDLYDYLRQERPRRPRVIQTNAITRESRIFGEAKRDAIVNELYSIPLNV